jgi:hypothetical protein
MDGAVPRRGKLQRSIRFDFSRQWTDLSLSRRGLARRTSNASEVADGPIDAARQRRA